MHRDEHGLCQTIHGASLDAAIGAVLIEAMTPLAVDVALAVQQEVVARRAEADRLRRKRPELPCHRWSDGGRMLRGVVVGESWCVEHHPEWC